MLSVFCSPSRYTQGKNATAALGAEMNEGLFLSRLQEIKIPISVCKAAIRGVQVDGFQR